LVVELVLKQQVFGAQPCNKKACMGVRFSRTIKKEIRSQLFGSKIFARKFDAIFPGRGWPRKRHHSSGRNRFVSVILTIVLRYLITEILKKITDVGGLATVVDPLFNVAVQPRTSRPQGTEKTRSSSV